MIPIFAKRELMLIGTAYREIDEILRLPDSDFFKVADTVSRWSPAQQICHVGMVNTAIFARIEKLYQDEDPEIARGGGPTLAGLALLTFGRIPRGRAQAPKQVEPPPDVDRAQVRAAVAASKRRLPWLAEKGAFLNTVPGRMPHPFLGNFTALQWLKFVRVHTRHHLQIVELIRRSPASHLIDP